MIPLDGTYDAFPTAELVPRFTQRHTQLTSRPYGQRLQNSFRPLGMGFHAPEQSHFRRSGSAPE